MDCLLRPSMDPLIRMLVTKNALRIDANAVKNFPLKYAAAVSFVVKVTGSSGEQLADRGG